MRSDAQRLWETKPCPIDQSGSPWINACRDTSEWASELEQWGKRVNYFITQICELLEEVGHPCVEEPETRKRQPGDPPPPPWKPSENG